MQASYLAEKEQRNWSDMPAGGGQLGSGQCIGGIVSSNLHLHWPGTPKATSFKCMGGLVSSKLHLHWPGTPKASSALESKELSSFHKRPGSRASSKKLITALAGSKGINYRGAFMSTNEHQNHFSHVDQVSTNCVNTRKKFCNLMQKLKAYTQSTTPEAPTKATTPETLTKAATPETPTKATAPETPTKAAKAWDTKACAPQAPWHQQKYLQQILKLSHDQITPVPPVLK